MNIKQLKEYIKDLPDDMEISSIEMWDEWWNYLSIENWKLTVV